MGSSYHQFCPVAKAIELLDKRWTLLVVRELVTGSEHFNQLRRGLPRMSPTLLSKRLLQLTRAGVVDRRVEGPEVRSGPAVGRGDRDWPDERRRGDGVVGGRVARRRALPWWFPLSWFAAVPRPAPR